ncbi:hypothetical protein IQ276_003550 [Desmonostoc muscorum LEGE 12446]|uniref:PEP-CTERM sorting domain-containing protein n=1 Tax=Desmonostoc muscorum LEGE 12446 TaxID=1828758 RepID=A0A8J7AD51_DESMC|nr:PEP-CTERM sorting domain-containing protein [Desmonostoc muscorum]MCF2145543.1 hypothetical protein [Desmonostoc muscorum LEGE 12446]
MKLSKILQTSLVSSAVAVSLYVGEQSASAASFSAEYPSSNSTVIASLGEITPGEFGYFWSVQRGDSITETFSGTGLNSVDSLDLNFNISQNFLALDTSVLWDVLVNGIDIGDWSWSDADGIGNFSQSYIFPEIIGGGNYTISMNVLNEVPRGFGSIAIQTGTATFSTKAVPEPNYMLGLVLTLGMFGVTSSLKRKGYLN